MSRLQGFSLPSLTLMSGVSFASSLATPPFVVDAIRTTWSTSPFPDLPSAFLPSTPVFELSITSSASGTSVPLEVTAGSGDLPLHFLTQVQHGTSQSSVCAGRGTSRP